MEADCIILEKDIQILLDSYKKYQNCFIVTPTFYNEKSELSYNGGPLPDNNIGIFPLEVWERKPIFVYCFLISSMMSC